MSQQQQYNHYEPQPQPPPLLPHHTMRTFTNHDFLAGADATIRAFLTNANVPIVFAMLWPTFTLADAQYEGMLFGRSLAYIISDTMQRLNAYWPTIGITDPKDFESEERLCAGILKLLDDCGEFRNEEIWVQLGWREEIFRRFFASVRVAFAGTLERRA